MFEPGTKVIVIASSTTKSVGARHGSIGYATDCGHPEYIGDICIGESTVAVAPTAILFTRYGFGKERDKYEKKNILMVFPIFPEVGNKKQCYIEKVNSFIKRFKKEKFDESLWYNTKSVFSQRPESTDVCIVAPYPVRNHALLDSSDTEFGAWFDSIILSHRMGFILNKINKPNYAIKFPENMRAHFARLRDCAMHRDARVDFLWALKKDPELKKTVIETLRMVYCVGIRKDKATNRKSTMLSFQKKAYYTAKSGRIKPVPFYRMFIENVFNDQAFERSDKLFRSFSIKNRYLISDNVKETKVTLQNMASVLSCR